MGRISGQHMRPEERADIVAKLKLYQTPAELARAEGLRRGTVFQIAREEAQREKVVTFPKFVMEGDEEESIDEILARQMKAFERKAKAAEARKWFTIQIHEEKPYGIIWFGDPHIDDSGCNLPLLRRHLEVAKQPGIYGGNIGDTTNNWPWTGRLARLWAESEVSDKTAKKMAEWFMFDAGVRWLVWLIGNHDEWNGGADFYKRLGASYVPVIDWAAQFTIAHASGATTRIDAAHGRKGSSIYNPAHGTLRAAKFGEEADMFVTGHIHSFQSTEFEDADRQHKTWLLQARGYKFHDHYAKTGGFAEYQHGASILSVIDPATGRVLQCFSDPEEGADYLEYKRR